ncbi:MAG: ATP-binding protein [Eubacteriales bacterium]|nr:ATP-binding protein [Eubacteriales bacterium]
MIVRNLYLQRMKAYIERPEIKIITGTRRSGKTTLIMQMMNELKKDGVNSENIIYMDFESLMYLYLNKTEDFKNLLWSVLESKNGHCYLFLDELKGVDRWALVCREISENFDCDIFAISSTKSVMYEGFDSDLCYCYVNIEIFPLLFSEYLELIKGRTGYQGKNMNELFLEYIRKGSFPAVYSMDDNVIGNYLKDTYSSIILKDVVQFNNLRDISHIDKIMSYIMDHIGEIFSPKMIKDYIKERGLTISVDTIYSILDALIAAGVIFKVQRYDIKTSKTLETQEKYYVCDLNMRSQVTGDFSIGFEQAIENTLYMELMSRGFKVSLGKIGKYIIDFRAEKNQDVTYINCCYKLDSEEKIDEKFTPLLKIRDNYFKMVISMDEATVINKGGIINYPLISFLKQE